jgi:hypothetical protein
VGRPFLAAAGILPASGRAAHDSEMAALYNGSRVTQKSSLLERITTVQEILEWLSTGASPSPKSYPIGIQPLTI